MIDADFIKQCSDPRLNVEIVQEFVQAVGAADHLTVTVKSGNRTYAIPKPTTPEDAMTLTKQYVGQAVVRVGLTQYPAGVGVQNVDDLSMNLFDPCENLRMGTALFSKVYRIVTKWYGNPRPEAVEDAILSYQSGYFEGKSVFSAEDPGEVAVYKPVPAGQLEAAQQRMESGPADPVGDVLDAGQGDVAKGLSEPPFKDEDPNKASMRIDLSGIKSHNVELKATGQ